MAKHASAPAGALPNAPAPANAVLSDTPAPARIPLHATGPNPRAAYTAETSVGPRWAGEVREASPRPAVLPRILALDVGLRTDFFTDAGFDPFSHSNALPEISFSLARPILANEAFAIVVGAAYDYGATSASARGQSTDLSLHRLTARLEAREYFLHSRLYAYGRVAPGALYWQTRLVDPSAAGDLSDHAWQLAADASAGVAFLVAGAPTTRTSTPAAASSEISFWLAGEGGYGFAARRDVMLTGSNPDVPIEPLPFGSLRLSGAFYRLYASIAY